MLIAQITDLHVVGNGQLCQGRVATNAQLQGAVAHINNLDPRPDVVLATGTSPTMALSKSMPCYVTSLRPYSRPWPRWRMHRSSKPTGCFVRKSVDTSVLRTSPGSGPAPWGHSPCGRRDRPPTPMPIRLSVRALAFRWGLPSLLPTRLHIPPEVSRVQHGKRKRNEGGACCSRPHPRSAAPQALSRVGQVDLECPSNVRSCAGPYSGVAPTISGMTGWHLRQGMPGAPFPVGLDTLQVMHHVIPQPSHHLLRACLPRMGPCRSMLLTP